MGEGVFVGIIMGLIAVVYLITDQVFLSIAVGFGLVLIFAGFYSSISDYLEKRKSEKKSDDAGEKGSVPLKPVLIWTAVFLCVIILSVYFVSNNVSCVGGGSDRYDFVTNGDGTRTWYDTTNDNIVRVD